MENAKETTQNKDHPIDVRVNAQGLLALVKGSPLGIVAFDLEGNIRLWNKAAEKISGWLEEEVLGQSIRIISKDSWGKFEEFRRRTLLREQLESVPVHATRKDGTDIIISYSAAPVLDPQNQVIATVVVLNDITEKATLEAALTDSLKKMTRMVDETVSALASAIEKRDPYTAGHQQRVAKLASTIAREMDRFDDDRIKGILTAASIHDIGKLYVPAEILCKPGILSGNEFGLIKDHPQAGFEILKDIEFPWPIATIVRQHHERFNGSGYPAGLTGEDILPEAAIIGVADVVEAMSSHRPYRAGK